MRHSLSLISGVLAGAALLLSSCASDTQPQPEPGNATGNPAAWTVGEITQENINTAVASLPDLVSGMMEQSGAPGVSVAVVHNSEPVFTEGFGVRQVGEDAKVNPDTVFQIASLSKPVGATVVSRSVSDGVVDWEDPVTDYLPDFKLNDPYPTANVTIADFYSHRSGLPFEAGDRLEDLGYDQDAILTKLRQLPLGLFRVQYAYSNFGLTTAAEAVAAANQTSWAALSQSQLYEPLGMDNTSSLYADYLSAQNRAITHQRTDDGWLPGEPRDPDAQSPAGGVSSTATDMAKWMQLQLSDGSFDGEKLIKPEVIQLMRQPHSVSVPATDPAARSSMYGYGIGSGVDGTGNVRWSHSGAFVLGTATVVDFLPAAGLGIVVLTNGTPYGLPEAVAASFMDIAETGAVQRDWLAAYGQAFAPLTINPSELAEAEPPSDPVPAKPLRAYTGTYRNSYFGPAELTISQDELVMQLGPDEYRFVLTHWDGDRFSYVPTGENGLGITAIDFDVAAGTMTVENLDNHGLGTFRR